MVGSMDEYVYMCLSTCEHVYTFLYRPEVISQGALYLDFGGQCLSLALSLRILLSCHRTLSHLPDTRITDGHYHACLSWVLGTERRSSYSLSDHFTNPVPTPNLSGYCSLPLLSFLDTLGSLYIFLVSEINGAGAENAYPGPAGNSWRQTSTLLMEIWGWLVLRGKGFQGKDSFPRPCLGGTDTHTCPLPPSAWDPGMKSLIEFFLASGHLALLCSDRQVTPQLQQRLIRV